MKTIVIATLYGEINIIDHTFSFMWTTLPPKIHKVSTLITTHVSHESRHYA